MLTLINDILKNSDKFGAKTINLVKLKKNEFNVPQFAAVSNEALVELENNPTQINQLINEINQNLKCKAYAVRSSALIEDTSNESMAGQFTTELNVAPEALATAIQKVIKQGKEYLEGNVRNFSLIIQEFINPDYAGVVFTRNPVGTIHGVIEYFPGLGELLVSGQIKPERIVFDWNNLPKLKFAKDSKIFLETFCKIEKIFGSPQDIEWCMYSNNLYIVQTRPITTINEYKQIELDYLEDFLNNKTEYYYYKNELSQILPRPTKFMLDLIELIYSQRGPIYNVYKKYGVTFYSKRFWEIIGNEIFIIKSTEYSTLLPTNWIKKIWNMWQLFKINPTSAMETDFISQADKLLTSAEPNDIKMAITKFLKVYEFIFEVNLLAERSLKEVEIIANREGFNTLSILSADLGKFEQRLNSLLINSSSWKGNTIDIADQSTFYKTEFMSATNSDFERWWNTQLSGLKQEVYGKKVISAQYFNKLREVGRWLTIKSISDIRSELYKLAMQNNFLNQTDIFFCSIEDMLQNKINEKKCIEYKEAYEKYKNFNLPRIISSQIEPNDQKYQFVSGNKIEGILVNEALLSNTPRPRILVTKDLSPTLVTFFGEIDGIIAENGSLLSHLAIIAREKNISVVIVDSISNLKAGDKISLTD
jgi:phosphohistidine swiveling domain-containing protein